MATLDLQLSLPRHGPAMVLLLGLPLIGFFFGLGIQGALALLFFLVSGYALAHRLLQSGPLESALASFPFAVAFTGVLLYALNVLGLPVLSPFVFIPVLLVPVAWALLPAKAAAMSEAGPSLSKRSSRKRKQTAATDAPFIPNQWLPFLTVALVLFAFIIMGVYLGKMDFGREAPLNVTSIDSAVQLAQMEWMLSSGTYTFDPSFINNHSGFEPTNFTPVAILAPTVFASLAGLRVWGAMALFMALCFAFAVAAVLLLSTKLFGTRVGLLAGFLLAILPKAFFIPFRVGMYRVAFAVLLFPLLLYLALRLLEGKRLGLAFGFLAAALLLTHPAHALLLLWPLGLLAVLAFRRRDRTQFKQLGLTLLPSVFGLVFYVPSALVAVKYRPSQFLGEGVTGPILITLEAAEKIAEQSNSIYNWADMPLHFLVVPLLVLAFLVFTAVKRGSLHPGKIAHKPLFLYLSTFILFLFLGTGVFTNTPRTLEYLMKFRFVLMSAFLVPLTAYAFTLPRLLFKASSDRVLALASTGFLVLIFTTLFALPSTFEPNRIEEKLHAGNYPAILWVRENTPPEATVLFLYGYEQYVHHFSHRRSTYISPQKYNDTLLSGRVGFNTTPVCDNMGGAFRRKGLFEFELPDCSGLPTQLCDYDYLVLRLPPSELWNSLSLKLLGWLQPNFDLVYKQGDYHVLKGKNPAACRAKDPVFAPPTSAPA